MEKINFTNLEAAMARDWLNLQVRNLAMRKASCAFNDSVRVMPPHKGGIHMDEGIVYITDLLGLELKEEPRDSLQYRWEYSFVYSGTRFYQISNERLGKYAEAADV